MAYNFYIVKYLGLLECISPLLTDYILIEIGDFDF